MASKKKTKKKKDGGGKGGGVAELRATVEALMKQMEEMNKTIKKQAKRMTALETDNKRFKKTLRKFEMGIGSGAASDNPSTAPKNSETEPTDIEASGSERESKDDDSKETEKLAVAPAKPKRESAAQARRRKAKSAPKEVRFAFDFNHQKIKVADNGAAAVKPKVYGGTIRFGRFLNFVKNNNDKIVSYKIVFDTRSIGQNSSLALGFATKSFGNWIGSNFGQNNCVMVKGNSQVLTTDKIFKFVEGKEYKHKQNCEALLSAENPKDGFFKEGEFVAVELGLRDCIGKVWNETRNAGGGDPDKVFEIKLPSDYEVCVVAYMGGSAKKRLTVKDQSFVFDE